MHPRMAQAKALDGVGERPFRTVATLAARVADLHVGARENDGADTPNTAVAVPKRTWLAGRIWAC